LCVGNEEYSASQTSEKYEKMYIMERTLERAHQKRPDEKRMRIDGDIPKVLEAVSGPVAVRIVCAWEMRYRVSYSASQTWEKY
jgi:hypothetical protein